ncbi:MAG: hypothetical protein V4712_08365 [Pseudomonadota bacterium]
MTRTVEAIAAAIRATGKPVESCVSMPFAGGDRFTVWFDRITPDDWIALQRLLRTEPAAPLTYRQHRSIAEANASGDRRRRR